MTPKEICNIIRVCNSNNVANFKFGEVEVSFHKSAVLEVAHTEGRQIPPLQIDDSTLDEQEADLLLTETVDLRKQQLDLLQVTDPVAYEELVASGDLLDESQEEDDFGP